MGTTTASGGLWRRAALASGGHRFAGGKAHVWSGMPLARLLCRSCRFVLLNTLRHPRMAWPPSMQCGAALGLVGLCGVVGLGLWALREDRPYDCPVCGKGTSAWRFGGAYLPLDPNAEGGNRVWHRKGHVRCMRCVDCPRAVGATLWLGGPGHRPYHSECWAKRCADMWQEEEKCAKWCEAEEVTDCEVAHVLAAAIAQHRMASMVAILQRRPRLQSATLPNPNPNLPGFASARHCAAAVGNRSALKILLSQFPTNCTCLDLQCEDDISAGSLWIRNMPDESYNDVYVRQPVLTYHQKPVYVGLRTGLYIYFHAQEPGEGQREVQGQGHGQGQEQTPGQGHAPEQSVWCVSSHLGSTTSTKGYRLLLDKHCLHQGPAQETAAAGPLYQPSSCCCWPQRRSRVESALHAHKARSGTASGHADGPADVTGQLQSEALSPGDVDLRRIPHAVSVLESALPSSDTATVEYLVAAYKERYAQEATWEYEIAPGLWHAYPPDFQKEICTARSAGRRVVRLKAPGFAAAVHLHSLKHEAGDLRLNVRCRLGPLLQHRKGGGQWAVTCDPSTIDPDSSVYVILGFGSTAAVTCSAEHLTLLVTEALVDPTLWKPPCKNPKSRNSIRNSCGQHFASELEQFTETALGPACREAVGRDGGPIARPVDTTRYSDGLEVPTETPFAFYDAEYRCNISTLQFCLALPDTTRQSYLALPETTRPQFAEKAVKDMCVEAVMKVYELGRQRLILDMPHITPLHVLPVFVYTYELDKPSSHQIYKEINRCAQRKCPVHALSMPCLCPVRMPCGGVLRAVRTLCTTMCRTIPKVGR